MTAYNAGKASAVGDSSSAWLASESNSLSDYSGCGAAELSLSSTDGKDSAMQALPGTPQAENGRLRGSVTSLETALHRTIDCLKQATSEAARQKRQSGMRVSAVVTRLGNHYAGYEKGRSFTFIGGM